MDANTSLTGNGSTMSLPTTGALQCAVYEDSVTVRGFKAFGYSVVLIISLLGNALVIFLITKHKPLQTTMNLWILNMAVSDLLFPLVAMPFQTAQIFTGHLRWFITGSVGTALCKITLFLGDLTTAISLQSFVFIAVERFCAVKYPMKVSLIRAKLKFLIPLTWFVGVCFHTPYFFIVKLVEVGGKAYCVTSWSPVFDDKVAKRNYFLVAFVLLYAVPLILLSMFYTAIIVLLKQKKLTRTQNKHYRRLRRQQYRSVLKMFVSIVCVFFVCSTPMLVVAFLLLFRENTCLPKNLRFVFMLFAQSYPAWNPIVYFVFSENFRIGLRRLFPRRANDKRYFNESRMQPQKPSRTPTFSMSSFRSRMAYRKKSAAESV